jgi:hypothetical protein
MDLEDVLRMGREPTLQMKKGAGVVDVEGSWQLEDHDTRHVWCTTVTQRGEGKNKKFSVRSTVLSFLTFVKVN